MVLVGIVISWFCLSNWVVYLILVGVIVESCWVFNKKFLWFGIIYLYYLFIDERVFGVLKGGILIKFDLDFYLRMFLNDKF